MPRRPKNRATGPETAGAYVQAKTCARCGRPFHWQRRWASSWGHMRYCSQRCRRARIRPVDKMLEQAIIELTRQRGPHKTICPSEAARAVGGASFRKLMKAARYAGNRLAHRGLVEATQRGNVVDAALALGPIRIRMVAGSISDG